MRAEKFPAPNGGGGWRAENIFAAKERKVHKAKLFCVLSRQFILRRLKSIPPSK
jgi:hypothetical protein